MVKLVLIIVLLFTCKSTCVKGSPNWDVSVLLSLNDSCIIEGDSMSVSVEIINKEPNAKFYIMEMMMIFYDIQTQYEVFRDFPTKNLYIDSTLDENSIVVAPGERSLTNYKFAINELLWHEDWKTKVAVYVRIDTGKRKKKMTIMTSQDVAFKVHKMSKCSVPCDL